MATDGHNSRRKHRRSSSPGDSEKSSKRHKHRHHHHRHLHGSRKRDEESEYDGETVPSVTSPTPAPKSAPVPDDDVEEGEILEEEDGEVRKKQIVAEPGEIEVIGDRDVRSDKANLGLHAKNLKIRSEGISDEIFIRTYHRSHIGRGMHEDDGSPIFSTADRQDGKDARASSDVMGNGHYSKREKRHTGELGRYKGNEKLKGDYDDEDLQVNGGKVNYRRNSSPENGGEKYRMSGCLPAHDRDRSRSRSSDHIRGRSRSCSIVEEYRRHSGEQEDLSYAGRLKCDNDLDDERMVVSRSERGHVSRDNGRGHSASYHSWEAQDRDRSKVRDVDRDLKREKERERSRNRELDRLCRMEKEHGSSHERRRRDIERGRSREREDDRDRRREKERDRSWETVNERDRRRQEQG